MKANRILGALAGALIVSTISTSASAEQYQFRQHLKGLTQTVSTPSEPTEPEISWELGAATLPNATSGKAYSYSFYDLITPGGLSGFGWSTESLPSWASLDPGTGELTGTPSASDVGNKAFAITATREGVNGQQVYTIVVGGQTLEVTQIAVGGSSTCAITTSGAAKCWGSNYYSHLGNGTKTDSSVPVDVSGLASGVVDITVNLTHACAVTTSGAAKCWGRNLYGMLGNGTNTDSSVPVDVSGLGGGVAGISAGQEHTCAVTTSGVAKCWGRNLYGRLGNGITTDSNAPVSVSGLGSGVARISAGGSHTCAVTTSGAAKCWGANGSGRLGNGTITSSSIPVNVTGLDSGVASISAGNSHTCAVTTSDVAKCWGYNASGQLGDGNTTNSSTPVNVTGLGSGVARISAGSSHTCAVTTSGAAKCWGYNADGRLGDGATTNSTTPVNVSASN